MVQLTCCQGQPAPDHVVDGWREYLLLPEDSYPLVWEIVVPGILDPGSAIHQERVQSFVESSKVQQAQASRIFQACGFLLSQACANDLSADALRNDLHLLSGGPCAGADSLSRLYPEVKPTVRSLLLQRAMADHGRVLVSLDWRIDQVAASNRGLHQDMPVVFLTLGYLEGDQRHRFSLQITPDGLKDFREFLARLSL